MSILVKHGDPGILVGLADAAGQLAGRGRVRDQVFQANLADQSRRRASSDSHTSAMALQDSQQRAQIKAQDNAAAIRARELASVRSLGSRSGRAAFDDETDPYVGGIRQSRARRGPAVDPYLDDRYLKAAQLEETRRKNLAAEEDRRYKLMQGDEATRRRLDQADMRIDQGQQRVDQGGARVAQGDRRLDQADTRFGETQRRNLSTEQLRREQMQATQERAAKTAAQKVAASSSSFDKNSELVAVGSALPVLKQILGPVLAPDGPLDQEGGLLTDESGQVVGWKPADIMRAQRADAAMRGLGRMRDKTGRYVLSLPELQNRMMEIAADPDLQEKYLPVIERDRNSLIREVTASYQQLEPVLMQADAAKAATALEQAAERAGMTPEDFTDSLDFLMEQGVIQRPGEGAGQMADSATVAKEAQQISPQEIDWNPKTGASWIVGSATDPNRSNRLDLSR